MHLDDLEDDTSHCQGCGTVLPIDRYYGRRRFCSSPCYNRQYRAIEAKAIVEAKAGRSCKRCGEILADHKNVRARFCSQYCQQKAFYNEVWKAKHPLTCQTCAEGFHGHHGRQKYCSPSCRAKAGVAVRLRNAAIRRGRIARCEAV